MHTNHVDVARAEVMAVLDGRVEACRAKDIDRLMSLYSPDIVYFDIIPPHRFIGADDVRRNFLRWFDEYQGDVGLETHELRVAVSAGVAFAHMLHPDSGTRKSGRDEVVCVRPCASSGSMITGSSPTNTSRSPSIPRTGVPSWTLLHSEARPKESGAGNTGPA